MNARIKELVAQVEKYISTTNFEGMLEDEMTYDEIFQKKFAELIVRECMRMCDCADVSLLEHNRPQEASGAAGAKEIIKEWFGVEE